MTAEHRLFSVLAASLMGCAAIPALPALAGTMQSFDPNSAFDPSDGTGYNYWHVQAGMRHEAVGQVDIFVGDNLTYGGFGSGSVIRDLDGGESPWILTAGHVVDTASYMTISFLEKEEYVNLDGIWFRQRTYHSYAAESWYVPESWSGFEEDAFVGNDIALIKLGTPVVGKTPYELMGADWEPNFDNGGDEFEAVGFGLTGDGLTGAVYDTGHRRAGANHLDFAFGSILISDFDPQNGANGGFYEYLRQDPDTDFPEVMEYQIAGGDSGGPDIIDGVIAGVHSFGLALFDGVPDSSYLDLAGSTNVADWIGWIDAVISGNYTTSLGGNFLSPILTAGAGGTVEEQRQWYADQLLALLIEEGVLAEGQFPDGAALLAANPAAEGFFLGTPIGNGPAVPEPATGMLALLGAGALGMMRRRRSRS